MAADPNNEDFMSGNKSIDRIRTVTASTFDRLVLKGEGPIVVEFMSYGCAHCGVIEPDLQQVAEMVESTEKISGSTLPSTGNLLIFTRYRAHPP